MTLLSTATEAKKFDTRIMEKNLSKGLVRSEEIEKFVKQLPDDSSNAGRTTWTDLERQASTSRSSNGYHG